MYLLFILTPPPLLDKYTCKTLIPPLLRVIGIKVFQKKVTVKAMCYIFTVPHPLSNEFNAPPPTPSPPPTHFQNSRTYLQTSPRNLTNRHPFDYDIAFPSHPLLKSCAQGNNDPPPPQVTSLTASFKDDY